MRDSQTYKNRVTLWPSHDTLLSKYITDGQVTYKGGDVVDFADIKDRDGNSIERVPDQLKHMYYVSPVKKGCARLSRKTIEIDFDYQSMIDGSISGNYGRFYHDFEGSIAARTILGDVCSACANNLILKKSLIVKPTFKTAVSTVLSTLWNPVLSQPMIDELHACNPDNKVIVKNLTKLLNNKVWDYFAKLSDTITLDEITEIAKQHSAGKRYTICGGDYVAKKGRPSLLTSIQMKDLMSYAEKRCNDLIDDFSLVDALKDWFKDNAGLANLTPNQVRNLVYHLSEKFAKHFEDLVIIARGYKILDQEEAV